MSSVKYSGENNLIQSIVLFIIFFVLFLGGIFALSFFSLESPEHAFIPGAVALVLVTLSFMIPLTWLSRATTADRH